MSQTTDIHLFDGKGAKNNPCLMILVSLFVHCALFSLLFFVPGTYPVSRSRENVYEVDLVDLPLPAAKRSKATQGRHIARVKGILKKKPAIRTKRIFRPKIRSKPVVIAKKTIDIKRRHKKKGISPSGLLEKAIGRIEKKVRSEKKDRLEEAIERLSRKVKREEARSKGISGGKTGAEGSITIRIYQAEVETRIKQNWTFPVGLANLRNKGRLKAVCLLKVKRDGTIVSFSFQKRSFNPLFDDSVERAIRKSNPLPPFPDGYNKAYDEIEITFNLDELDS